MSIKKMLRRKRSIKESMVSSSIPQYEGPKEYSGEKAKKIKPQIVKPYIEETKK